MTEQYLAVRSARGHHTDCRDRAGCVQATNRRGWTDVAVDESLVYSHRDTAYTRENFTEGLHAHEYYELLLYYRGDVEYVKSNTLIKPDGRAVICFAPGHMHTARLVAPSRYERVVLYFTEDFFRHKNEAVPMTDFIERAGKGALVLDETTARAVDELVRRIDDTAASDLPFGGLLIKAYLIELFGLLNRADTAAATERLSDDMTEVKRYIDASFATIDSIGAIAERFHYSREHLSRKFKSRFNIAISDYLAKRRVIESLPYVGQRTGAELAAQVGFCSQAAFIAAFKHHMGYLPSAYKRK